MANLTRLQVRDYIRAKLNRLDSQRITDGMLNIDINLSQRKVQTDLMGLGLKQFTKPAYLTGSVSALPTDMLSVPSSIIDAKAGTGTVRASKTIAYTTPTGNLIHTALEPGTAGNSISISCDAATFGAPAVGTITCIYSGGILYLDFASGVLTGTQIAALFNADPVYNKFLICSTAYPSAVIVPSVGTAGTLAGGTGTGWYPAKELSVEDYNRDPNNAYLAPSATDPAYKRFGSSTGVQHIEWIPNTVTYSMIYYKYLLADLSTDSGSLSIPIEYEELVLMDILTKTYKTLKENADSQAQAVEYEAKVKDLEAKYQNTLTATMQEKMRLNSSNEKE